MEDLLRKQAKEIADKGIAGWGNTMISAADEIKALKAAMKEIKEIATGEKFVAYPFHEIGKIYERFIDEDT